ncbi:nuclear transport factor 2 family protein [Rhodospirillum centenum]|uniref:SnoaL-like domain-containing protein n=1 Tax=Rhodospirillum centenum (strain ATCC 51521 / SW) TaxID=414684 RepID=B6IS60_RHOCS|nr:nuclear transport factor 2 family protein [Rhodospirillum centenum]ACI98296.1 conserved hypothetical protein [Rhodospirillum centenum SW]
MPRPRGDAPGADAGAVVTALWEGMAARHWDTVRRLVAEELVVEWPQTRERIRGADAFVALNRREAGERRVQLGEVVASGDRAAARVRITTGRAVLLCSGFYRLRDGLIAEAVETFAESASPPGDRIHLAERY